MGSKSNIEWTEATWNPVAGCSIVSPGCSNCYAMRLASRLEAMGQAKYKDLTRRSGGRSRWNGRINLDRDSLYAPFQWKTGRLVFVNSMSDLFHEDVPLEFVQAVFHTMREASQHTFQVLTKRGERLIELSDALPWCDNVWMGVSVENSSYYSRIDRLRESGAHVRFQSLEPLLGPLDELDLTAIDWVIAGGESGPGARPLKEEWVIDIRNRCQREGVPFHFKQWGGTNKKAAGRLLEGRTWDELPHKARTSHFPEAQQLLQLDLAERSASV